MLSRLRSSFARRRQEHFYRGFIGEGNLCFDVGANLGNKTAVFVKLGGTVVAIEPQADCVLALGERFKRNPTVRIEPIAVGDKPGEAVLHVCRLKEVSTLSSEFIKYYRRYDYLQWDRTQSVQVTTLDALIAKHGRPQFCKIDVEGYEWEVLQGLSVPIPCLEFEFTAPFRHKTVQCLKTLGRLGVPRFNYFEYEHHRLMLRQWLETDAMIETVNHFPDHLLHGNIMVSFP